MALLGKITQPEKQGNIQISIDAVRKAATADPTSETPAQKARVPHCPLLWAAPLKPGYRPTSQREKGWAKHHKAPQWALVPVTLGKVGEH